jgi:hypothetical protein
VKSKKWFYYLVAGLLVLIYFVGEATDVLVLAMFIILPVGWWVISNIFDPNS